MLPTYHGGATKWRRYLKEYAHAISRIIVCLLWLAVATIILYTLLGIPCISQHVVYLAQVISGNWNGSRDPPIGYIEFLGDMILAVIINLATLGGIFAGAVKIIKLERRVMRVEDMYSLKDMVVQDKLLDSISESLQISDRKELRQILKEAFKKGDKAWREEYLPIAVPDDTILKKLWNMVHVKVEPR